MNVLLKLFILLHLDKLSQSLVRLVNSQESGVVIISSVKFLMEETSSVVKRVFGIINLKESFINQVSLSVFVVIIFVFGVLVFPVVVMVLSPFLLMDVSVNIKVSVDFDISLNMDISVVVLNVVTVIIMAISVMLLTLNEVCECLESVSGCDFSKNKGSFPEFIESIVDFVVKMINSLLNSRNSIRDQLLSKVIGMLSLRGMKKFHQFVGSLLMEEGGFISNVLSETLDLMGQFIDVSAFHLSS